MVAFTKPGLVLVELNHVPVRSATAIGRIDVIGSNMIFTCYKLQPGDDGIEEAVVIDKVEFPAAVIPEEIQFAIMVLAKAGFRAMLERGPVLVH